MNEPLTRRIMSPFKKIVSVVLWRLLLPYEAKHGGSFFAVKVLLRHVTLEPGRTSDFTVLCVERENFSKDVAILRRTTSIHWAGIHVSTLRRVMALRTPPEMQIQTYYEFYQDSRHQAARASNHRLFARFYEALRRHQRIDAVLSSNIDYWQDGGLLSAGPEAGIAFLVLLRELLAFSKSRRVLQERYQAANFRFPGTAVAVFGQIAKDVLIDVGACRPDQVRITGAPRFDGWRFVGTANTVKDTVTLIAYRGPEYRAQRQFVEVLSVFAAAAAVRPDLKFVVKCKGDRAAKEFCPELLEQPQPQNLAFDGNVALFDLFPRSVAVIGFNTTALLEGLLTEADLIVPFWGETRKERDSLLIDPYDSDHAAVFHFPSMPEELRDILLGTPAASNERAPTLEWKQKRKDVFRTFFHFPDAKTCSQEVAEFCAWASDGGI